MILSAFNDSECPIPNIVSMSRNPGQSSQAQSDEEDSFNGRIWNSGKFEVDHFLAGQEKGHQMGEDPKESQREQLVDSDFFNDFPDDFDETDMS